MEKRTNTNITKRKKNIFTRKIPHANNELAGERMHLIYINPGTYLLLFLFLLMMVVCAVFAHIWKYNGKSTL